MTSLPIDPSKLLVKGVAPVLKFVRQQAGLQDADLATIRLGRADKEIDEALDVLALNAPTAARALLQYVKGKIADRPEVFSEEPVPQWLATEKVRDLVRRAVYAYIDGKNVQEHADEAASFFAEFAGADGPGRGYAAFEYAVPFALLSIANRLDTGDRLILSAISDIGNQVAAATAPLPRELLDTEVSRELETLRRSRFYAEVDLKAQAVRLAARVDGGDLSRASDGIRARALAICAIHLARAAETAEADRLLAISAATVATEEGEIAKATLAAIDDPAQGLALLAPMDTPARRLAALGMAGSSGTARAIVEWAEAAGIDMSQLDSDGRHVLLYARVQDGRWEVACADAAALTPEDLAATPAIALPAAIARVAKVVPPDLRHVVAAGVPLGPVSFPLSDTRDGLAVRRRAAEIARTGSRQAAELGAREPAGVLATFALWLELRDPDLNGRAMAELATLLDGPDAIRWIPLGVAFGVVDDLATAEAAVQRAAALNPKGSPGIALARLVLGMAKPTPGEAADYVARHRASMAEQLDRGAIAEMEIGMLMEAGRAAEAAELLAASEDHLDEADARRLAEQVRTGAAGDTLAQLEAAYADDPSTATLAPLVSVLAQQGVSDRFFDLARRLIASTKSVATAEMTVAAAQRARKWDQLSVLLADIPDLIGQSAALLNARAWDAYRRGDLAEAEAALADLPDAPSTRSLRHNMLLVSGRWPDIVRVVEDEWAKRDLRSAREVLELAQLARQCGSGRVWELLKLAVAKAPGDPHVLAGAYMLATQAGLDDTREIHGWLESAAALSGEDGPIRRADLADLVADQPDWDRRTSDVHEQLRAGALPLFLAAKLTGRPTLELRLAAMVVNQRERDPRLRAAVPAFSGARGTAASSADTLGLDGGALATLGALGLLDAVVARGRVTIPHSTLGWLFQERQRLAFHQPSRVSFAHRLQRELASGRMTRFSPSAPIDGRLADSVGLSLAAMLAAAAARPEGSPQRLVVRSAPVQRVGTFRGEAVDLGAHAKTLCSCLSLVDALEESGHLDASQARHARTFLEVNEERWPEEPAIEDGAELYLDDLSVSYLDSAGVLGAIHAAGFRAHLSERQVDEINAFIELEARAAEIDKVIEHIRSALAAGIAAGTVSLFPLADAEEEVMQHPDVRVMDLAGHVDAIVSDDRSINRVRQIDGPAGSSPVWTSLDVLSLLAAEGAIDRAELTAHRTTLRRSGLVLFPIDGEELVSLVAGTHLRDGGMVETAELRALRENLQLALMRRYLKLPEEAEYLQTVSRAVVHAVLGQWTAEIPDAVARARSIWLLARADLRDWAAAMPEGASALASHGQAIPLTSLIAHRLDVEEGARSRFDAWLEEEVVAPLRHQEPKVFEWLLDQTRAMLLSVEANDDAD